MANPHRGEVALQAGEDTYRFCFTIDALCQLEERLDLSIVEISGLLNQGAVRLKVLRAILWAGLQTHHAPIDEKAAGELIGQIGAVPLMGAIVSAMNQAFGADEEAADEAGDPPAAGRRGKPRTGPAKTPAAGTGSASSTSGASST